jgi:hypothetical protein
MKPSLSKASLLLLCLLICLGAGALALAFWLLDDRSGIENSGILIAISMGVFFISSTAALLLVLGWRDRQRAMKSGNNSTAAQARPDLEGTVYGLSRGRRYRVVRPFTDYYGNSFEPGETLRFKERHFLPYDGGHTIVFHERPLYLQEERNQEILDHFSDYIVEIVE